jgi:hypothetical protein
LGLFISDEEKSFNESETWMTLAEVTIDAIGAVAVNARVGEALVDVELAVLALGARRTPAAVAGSVLLTLATVLAGPAAALVHRPIAKVAAPTNVALALEGADVVDAAPVLARVVLAVVDVDLAPPAGEAGRAVADEGGKRVSTGTPIKARVVPSTVVLVDLETMLYFLA